MRLTGEPIAAPSTFHKIDPGKISRCYGGIIPRGIMSLMGNTALSFRVLPCSSISLIMPNAGSAGTEVDKAVTS